MYIPIHEFTPRASVRLPGQHDSGQEGRDVVMKHPPAFDPVGQKTTLGQCFCCRFLLEKLQRWRLNGATWIRW